MHMNIPRPGWALVALGFLYIGCAGSDPAEPPVAPAVDWQPGEVGALHNEFLEAYYQLDHATGHERPRGELFTRVAARLAARSGRPQLALPREEVEELAARMEAAIGELYDALASGEPGELDRWFEGAGIAREVGWRLLPVDHRPLGRQVLRPHEEMPLEDRQQLDRGLEVHAASGEFWRDRIPPDRDTQIGKALDEQDAVQMADAAGAVAGTMAHPLIGPIAGALASILMEEALEAGSEDPQPICTCVCTCGAGGNEGDGDSGG